jgi:hypothetical protein
MHSHLTRRAARLCALFVLGALLAACTVAPIASQDAPTSPLPTAVPPAASGSDSGAASGAETLAWSGNVEFGDGDPSTCKELRVDAAGNLLAGLCGEGLQAADDPRPEFAELAALVAPFELDTGTERIVFRGAGQEDDPAWQQAVLDWARWTFGEAYSGRACASCRTAVSWQLGEAEGQAGVCAHATVLNYGYAYAEQRPCGGGDVQSVGAGWLTTDEWAAFSGLMGSRATTYSGDNYVNGSGESTLSEAELADVAALMQGIYDRLAAQ